MSFTNTSYQLGMYEDLHLAGKLAMPDIQKAIDLQKARYSGKKAHNVKNNVLSLPDRQIIGLE